MIRKTVSFLTSFFFVFSMALVPHVSLAAEPGGGGFGGYGGGGEDSSAVGELQEECMNAAPSEGYPDSTTIEGAEDPSVGSYEEQCDKQTGAYGDTEKAAKQASAGGMGGLGGMLTALAGGALGGVLAAAMMKKDMKKEADKAIKKAEEKAEEVEERINEKIDEKTEEIQTANAEQAEALKEELKEELRNELNNSDLADGGTQGEEPTIGGSGLAKDIEDAFASGDLNLVQEIINDPINREKLPEAYIQDIETRLNIASGNGDDDDSIPSRVMAESVVDSQSKSGFMESSYADSLPQTGSSISVRDVASSGMVDQTRAMVLSLIHSGKINNLQSASKHIDMLERSSDNKMVSLSHELRAELNSQLSNMGLPAGSLGLALISN